MPPKNSAEIVVEYPINDISFINNKTILVCGGGGESSSGIPNKITAVRTSFKIKDKTKRLQKFREVILPKNEDAPLQFAICKQEDASEGPELCVLVGCNQSKELKARNINNNVRKYTYYKDHFTFCDAVQFDEDVVLKPITEDPKHIQVAPDCSVAVVMTTATPSEIVVFNPNNLESINRVIPGLNVPIVDLHLCPSDNGNTLTYITENAVTTIYTKSGDVVPAQITNVAKTKATLSKYILSKVYYIDPVTVLLVGCLTSRKGAALLEYNLSSGKIVKEKVLSKQSRAVGLTFNEANGLVAIAFNDCSVSLIRQTDFKITKTYKNLHSWAITCLSFCPNGSKLATGSAANTLNVIQIQPSSSFFGSLFRLIFWAIIIGLLAIGLQLANQSGQLDQYIELMKIHGGDAYVQAHKYGKLTYGLSQEYGAQYYDKAQHYGAIYLDIAQRYGKIGLDIAKERSLEGYALVKEKVEKWQADRVAAASEFSGTPEWISETSSFTQTPSIESLTSITHLESTDSTSGSDPLPEISTLQTSSQTLEGTSSTTSNLASDVSSSEKSIDSSTELQVVEITNPSPIPLIEIEVELSKADSIETASETQIGISSEVSHGSSTEIIPEDSSETPTSFLVSTLPASSKFETTSDIVSEYTKSVNTDVTSESLDTLSIIKEAVNQVTVIEEINSTHSKASEEIDTIYSSIQSVASSLASEVAENAKIVGESVSSLETSISGTAVLDLETEVKENTFSSVHSEVSQDFDSTVVADSISTVSSSETLELTEETSSPGEPAPKGPEGLLEPMPMVQESVAEPSVEAVETISETKESSSVGTSISSISYTSSITNASPLQVTVTVHPAQHSESAVTSSSLDSEVFTFSQSSSEEDSESTPVDSEHKDMPQVSAEVESVIETILQQNEETQKENQNVEQQSLVSSGIDTQSSTEATVYVSSSPITTIPKASQTISTSLEIVPEAVFTSKEAEGEISASEETIPIPEETVSIPEEIISNHEEVMSSPEETALTSKEIISNHDHTKSISDTTEVVHDEF